MKSELDDIVQGSCIHELIERQAANTPDAIALLAESHRITYGELNARANQLAHHLRKHGAAEEVFVGLCMERSAEAAIALLAILKSGAAHVYLDPKYPVKRLNDLMGDSQPLVVVTSAKLQHLLPTESICVDISSPLLADEDVSNPRSGVALDNAA